MKTLQSLLLATTLALSSSCINQKVELPFESNDSRKELVKTHGEVATNAKKYNLPLYILKKDGETLAYYTEGAITETNKDVGRIQYGYECTDNFWLFDDDIYNGIKTRKGNYSVESYDSSQR